MDTHVERMDEQMSLRGLAESTRTTYRRHVMLCATFHERTAGTLTVEDVDRYTLHLLRDRALSGSTRNQAAPALASSSSACWASRIGARRCPSAGCPRSCRWS